MSLTKDRILEHDFYLQITYIIICREMDKMNWIQCLSKSIQYIEDHITDRMQIDEIANQAYTSSSHFQLLFHLDLALL